MSKVIPNNPTRALFVEHQKKHQKGFLLAVGHILVCGDTDANSSDVAWNLGVLTHAITNLTAPAKLWDNAHQTQREVYWEAIGRCAEVLASSLEGEVAELSALESTIKSTPVASLNEVIPDPVDAGDDADDDDDGDDDDDDGDDDGDDASIPSALYHATPTTNVNDIMQNGLQPMRRQNVFLWDTKGKAIEVAERHGDADISVFQIDVAAFTAGGYPINQHDFARGDGLQFFTPEVPSVYLQVVT